MKVKKVHHDELESTQPVMFPGMDLHHHSYLVAEGSEHKLIKVDDLCDTIPFALWKFAICTTELISFTFIITYNHSLAAERSN